MEAVFHKLDGEYSYRLFRERGKFIKMPSARVGADKTCLLYAQLLRNHSRSEWSRSASIARLEDHLRRRNTPKDMLDMLPDG